MAGNWRTPKSKSFERFVMFVIAVLILIAFVISCFRYAFTAKPDDPPWKSVPIVSKL